MSTTAIYTTDGTDVYDFEESREIAREAIIEAEDIHCSERLPIDCSSHANRLDEIARLRSRASR